MSYVPLHIHTEYSLLDGAIKIKQLCDIAQANDMPAVAITDHGVMYGAIELYLECKDRGLKPLIGCEMYVYNGDIKEKIQGQNELFHLVLIAKDKTGYQNLVKLVSVAHVDGFYYKPRINFDYIKQYSEGLICLSACIQGEVARNIIKGKSEEALEVAKKYKEVFGDDYYIEIQDHGLQEQKMSNPELIKIAKELGVGLVITNDSHYPKKEDANWHDTLLCIQTNALKTDEKRFRFPNNEFYIKNVAELREAFSWLDEETFNEAIENTGKVADKCHLVLEFGNAPLPNYEVPEGKTVQSYLEELVRQGLTNRYGEISPTVEERYKYELGVIEQMGFSAYFLITWDFVHYAKTHDVPVGPGRGSAAGSIVAYALGITDLDPMQHHLLFERCLNPERISMPDVDIDFCVEKRGKVIDYVTEKYGADKVCQIITFGTLAARNAMKAVARVYDIPYAESNKLAQLIPGEPKTKIDDALQPGMELKNLYDTDPKVKSLVDMAKSIEGIKNNIGMHAAGVIISYIPLDQVVPVQPSKDGIIITEYPMVNLEKLGLLKMDFLGLRNLTIINNCLKMIEKRTGKWLEINKIPLDDKETFDLLQKGDTDGVFQLESSGMKKLVRDLRPSVFEDLGALVALFRPGPLESGMVTDFVERKHGRQKITYAHPLLEPILKDTYGTIVYQEQIMQIFQSLAGYTLGGADMVRRMMGKKKLEEMAKQKEKFIEGAGKNGMSEKAASDLFEQIEKFASYCFNRSHSAAYAFVAYQTAYLKAHHPVEYMAALLSSVNNDQAKTQLYIAECKQRGIDVLAPDVNKSSSGFTPDENTIRFGLASIKNVGAGVIENIERERAIKPFESMKDFCTRMDMHNLNKRVFESLIRAGVFSTIEPSRKKLIDNLDYMIEQAARMQEQKNSGQVSLFAGMGDNDAFKDATFQLAGSDEEYPDKIIQTFEKEYLGFYITSHPLSSISKCLPFLKSQNIAELADLPNEKMVTVCGLLTQVRQIPTKKDPTKFLKAGVIEDLTGKVEFVAFHKTLQQCGAFLNSEEKVVITGKINRQSEDQFNIMVESARSVDNCNLVTFELDEEVKFEDMMALKELIKEYKGDDPLIFKLHNGDNITKILTSTGFWLKASNDLAFDIRDKFNNKIKVEIESLA